VIRVMLIDDHASTRQPLAILLDHEDDLTVVAQAASLAEARAALPGIMVDVAVVDLDLPDSDGVELIKHLRAANPDAMTMVLTGSLDRRRLARAVEAGASGVIHKTALLADIISGIRRLHGGESLLSPREALDLLRLIGMQRDQDDANRLVINRLTVREREVLQALADGLSDREIAGRFNVSTKTVRAHMANLLAKLNVDSRLQALIFAVRHGVVEIR
jgi:DNA-binding NarL/FixJ family response regulator